MNKSEEKRTVAEVVAVVFERVGLPVALLMTAVALALTDHDVLAGSALGAATTYILPTRAISGVAPMLALIGGLALTGGCAGTTAGAVARVTCAVVARAHDACEVAGLSPDEPCPVFDQGAGRPSP